GARGELGDQRVAALVVGHEPALLGVEQPGLAGPEHDLVERHLEVLPRNLAAVTAGGGPGRPPWGGGPGGARGTPGGARRPPGVRRASAARSTFASSLSWRVWIRRIASRPARSGRPTVTWRSKRPGRSRAGSSTSGRLVAARTMTLVCSSKPSISTSSWLRVC